MIELKCSRCGSNDLEYKKGVYVCTSCGTKFIPEQWEESKRREDKLVDKLIKYSNKREKCDLSTDKGSDKWYDYTLKMDECIHEILEINENNVYARTFDMLSKIGWSLNEEQNARGMVEDAEVVLEYATEEELEDVFETLDLNFTVYQDKVESLYPELAPRVRAVKERLYKIRHDE